ncbi:hypothetical protein ASC92_21385 [Variovorax sp. Root411]|nr:hypothetical protein ASC92_21385 [Variovorax sp. Root411]
MGRLSLADGANDFFCQLLGGLRILPSDEIAIHDDMRVPWCLTLIERSGIAQAVFEKPGCVRSESNLSLFHVTESRDTTPLESPLLRITCAQQAGLSMAKRRDDNVWPSRRLGEQFSGGTIDCEVLHGTVATGQNDGLVLADVLIFHLQWRGELPSQAFQIGRHGGHLGFIATVDGRGHPRVVADDPEAECAAVIEGLGFGQLPAHLALPHLWAGRLISVATGLYPAPSTMYVYRPHRTPVPARIRLVFDALCAALASSETPASLARA